jgi:hypothetical protein
MLRRRTPNQRAHTASGAISHGTPSQALAAGSTPVVVGGTGLYFRAALADLDLPPAPPAGARARWEAVYDERGGDVADELLRVVEADSVRAAAGGQVTLKVRGQVDRGDAIACADRA